MILEMMFLHRASIRARLTSHAGEGGHGWIRRLLERVPTGQGAMSIVHKTGTDILYPPPPPPLPADSCAHGATASPVWRLALLSFLPLSLGLAAPLWAATGNVSNLSLTPSDGFTVSYIYPSGQGFTTGDNSGGYTLQQVTLKLKDNGNTDPRHPDVYLYTSQERNGTKEPNKILATMTAPTTSLGGSGIGNYVYTCNTGCALNANSQYFIVVRPKETLENLKVGPHRISDSPVTARLFKRPGLGRRGFSSVSLRGPRKKAR